MTSCPHSESQAVTWAGYIQESPSDRGRKKLAVLAVVVTYNRKKLLLNCINALLGQSADCDILLVDNDSTDGTRALLVESGVLENPRVYYLRLRENLGGAGGFAIGMWYALKQGWDWMWLMDDDALPDPHALRAILDISPKSTDVYGSVALDEVDGQMRLCWPILRVSSKSEPVVHMPEMLQPVEEVVMLPFLGFCIHRELVERCGLPDADLFIHGDDVEYCYRLRKARARIIAVKASVIRHPVPPAKIVRFPGYPIYHKSLPPWKRYYEVRNRIVIARRYYSWRLLTHTLPGILARATISLAIEKERRQQARAYFYGVLDGFLGRLGRRVW